MNISIYAINLNQSTGRWAWLFNQANEFDLRFVRVSAVDGRQISPGERAHIDDAAFQRNSGRILLPGEYGCDRSYLKALSELISSGDDVAVIVEGDVELTRDLCQRAKAAFDATPKVDAIKLFNHSVVSFVRALTIRLGDEVEHAIYGPLCSAACCGVTRSGAMKLLGNLCVIQHPCVAALERGWVHGARVYTMKQHVTSICRDETTIANRDLYWAVQFPKWKRLGTYVQRLRDDLNRTMYALNG